MTAPVFLEADAVVFLHDHALREYGGAHGVLEEALLESALGRPRERWAYAEPGSADVVDLAAAYACGLASRHAFSDANKRTAWSACALFLKLNGARLVAAPAESIAVVVDLAEGRIDEAGFARWLRSRCDVTP